ncbi:MAG: helix-turn-helix transcriptional regulator [Bacteroidota bacterium]
MKKLIKAQDLIAERYGKKGIASREAFRAEAFAHYFGSVIKARRKELNMSQTDLAIAVGKQRTYISRVENGEDIRLSNFALLANALDLSIQFGKK